jgi:hypothetical protein
MEKVKKDEITFEKLVSIASPGTVEINNETLYNKIDLLVNKYYPVVREFKYKDLPKPIRTIYWQFYFPCKDEEEGREYLIPFLISKTRNGDFFVELRPANETFIITKEGPHAEKDKREELLSLIIDKAIEIQDTLTKEEIESKVVYRYAWIKIKKRTKLVMDVDIPKEKLSEVIKWEELPVPKPRSKPEIRE